jgi:hypothetical protein
MRSNYPQYYKGPKAGGSEDEEWLAVTEFQAFMYIYDNTWFYSDFDCWLAARDRHHYKLGGNAAENALKEFQKMHNIKAEVKPWYENN